jgi:hypothetical protein
MKDLKILNCLFALLLVTATARAADDCVSNYRETGSFLSGMQYSTSQDFSDVTPHQAFQRAYAFTAQNGFTINNSNEDAGVISASQSVSYGQGKPVPLSVIVKPDGAGSKVLITYATSGGVSSPSRAIQAHFCKAMEAVAQR